VSELSAYSAFSCIEQLQMSCRLKACPIRSFQVKDAQPAIFPRRMTIVLWRSNGSEGAGTAVAKLSRDKSSRVEEQSGQGSETAVARCFEALYNWSGGGSFGGMELSGHGRRAERQGC
jgi:hypothetical protein